MSLKENKIISTFVLGLCLSLFKEYGPFHKRQDLKIVNLYFRVTADLSLTVTINFWQMDNTFKQKLN